MKKFTLIFSCSLLLFLISIMAYAGCDVSFYLKVNKKTIWIPDSITISKGDTISLNFSWSCSSASSPTTVPKVFFYKDENLIHYVDFEEEGWRAWRANVASINITEAGNYIVDSGPGWGGQVHLVVTEKKEPVEIGINIYPNLVHDKLILILNFLEVTEVNYSIFNALGEKLVERQLNVEGIENENLNIAELPPGLYIAAFKYGEEKIIKKFIKS